MPAPAAAEPVRPRKLLRKRDSANPPPHSRLRAPSDTSATLRPSADQPRDDFASPSTPIDSAAYPTPNPSRKHIRSQTFDNNSYSPLDTSASQQQYPRYSLREKPSTELFGQRFDSAAILNNFDTILQQPGPSAPPLAHQHSDLTPLRPTHSATATPRAHNIVANPDVRLSESLAATGRRMEDISQSRGPLGSRNPASRLSDEAKESKLKKKSGFSKFMNDLVGSPRRPAISAPENPVHVTHVGYDQETGEFTVCVYFGSCKLLFSKC